MLTLKQIKLQNFLSHKNTVINFDSNQKLLIDGNSGAGKSAIIEAIIWGLYGKGRLDNRSLIKSGEKMALVTITLANQSNKNDIVEYSLKRTILRAGQHVLSVLEKTSSGKLTPVRVSGQKNIQQYLEKHILHSSYLLFINSIAYLQDNVENFVNQTAKKRKEIILEIINASDYDEYYKNTKEKLSELNRTFDLNKSVIYNINLTLQVDEVMAKELKRLEKEDKRILGEIKKRRASLDDVNEKLSKIDVAHSRMSSLEQQEETIDSTINTATEELKELKRELGEFTQADGEFTEIIRKKELLLKKLKEAESKRTIWHKEMLELRDNQPISRSFDDEIDEINQRIIKLLGKKIVVCPVVKKICPLIEKERNKDVKELEEILKNKQKEQKEYVEKLNNYTKEVNRLGDEPEGTYEEIIKLSENIEKIKSSEGRKKIIAKSISYIEEKIHDLELTSKKLKEEFKALKKGVIGRDDLLLVKEDLVAQEGLSDSEYTNNLAKLSDSRSAKKRVDQNSQQIERLREENNQLSEDINGLKLLKDAFSPNGIKSIVIDYVIPQLEDKINNILGKLSDFKVRLDTQKKGITKDTLLEGLFINIYNDRNEEFDFAAYSGGEKLKITVAISEALSEIQNIGFRILDETFIGLDEESIEKFSEVMVTLQERVSQMICISHLRSIKDIFDEKLLVTKINGTSIISS